MTDRTRLYVALTSSGGTAASGLLEPLRGLPVGVKTGLELFTRTGPDLVRELRAEGFDVFLDLKFHDIPHTVGGAVESACLLGPSIVNVHASGGAAMMRAAAAAASGSGTRVIAVTLLTSMDSTDLACMGVGLEPADLVVRLALSARDSGLDGVVCSPAEASAVRSACGSGFLIVTPGIRSAEDERGDQKRTATAFEAVASGADAIVVGRPVTGAQDPRAAALRILDEIGRALPQRAR
jgi:orotidine-5'-phosphate decarboxylase